MAQKHAKFADEVKVRRVSEYHLRNEYRATVEQARRNVVTKNQANRIQNIEKVAWVTAKTIVNNNTAVQQSKAASIGHEHYIAICKEDEVA
jgi:hypothetical protein